MGQSLVMVPPRHDIHRILLCLGRLPEERELLRLFASAHINGIRYKDGIGNNILILNKVKAVDIDSAGITCGIGHAIRRHFWVYIRHSVAEDIKLCQKLG